MFEGAANSGPTTEARTVTLEVDTADAQAVQVAVRLGRLSLSVRPADRPIDAGAGRPVAATYASDISPALASDVPPSDSGQVMKVWKSTGDAKDFKF
jgi:Flp pilus assembly protein CpaB